MDLENINIGEILYKKLVAVAENSNINNDELDWIISELKEKNKNNSEIFVSTFENSNGLSFGLYSLLTWERNKTIIDATSLLEVSKAEMNDNLHMDILLNTPYKFFSLYFDKNLYLISIGEKMLAIIDLINNETFVSHFDLCINMVKSDLKMRRESNIGLCSRKAIKDKYYPIFNILVYLATENLKLTETKTIEKKFKNTKKIKSTEKSILKINYKISDLHLGKTKVKYEYAESIISNKNQNKTIISHIRKAHWHSFWTGSKKSNNRKLTVKWIAETYINGNKNVLKIKKIRMKEEL